MPIVLSSPDLIAGSLVPANADQAVHAGIHDAAQQISITRAGIVVASLFHQLGAADPSFVHPEGGLGEPLDTFISSAAPATCNMPKNRLHIGKNVHSLKLNKRRNNCSIGNRLIAFFCLFETIGSSNQ